MSNRLVWLGRIIALNLIIITVAGLAFAEGDNFNFPQPTGVYEGYELTEGDIMLPSNVVQGRATYEAKLWSNATVPYVFHSSVDSTNRNRMLAAMTSWEDVSGIDFVPRTSQSNYIEIINSGGVSGWPEGNWSYIGMVGGRQYLSIYNWTYHYIIMHELAHAAGFWHEQSRPDRDQYVSIKMKNVASGFGHNFAIRSTASTVGTYDFASIMHYDDYAFSYNGQPTIVAKPAYSAYQSAMGNRSYLTTSDADGMRRLYPEAGDTFKKALALPTQDYYSTTIHTANFEKDKKEPTPSCAPTTGRTVWYKIKPTHDRVLSIYTSGYDTVLAVYTGKPGEWKQHACSDVGGSGTGEYALVNAKAGQTYYIVVGGYANTSGSLTLEIYSYRNFLKNGDFQWGKNNWNVSSKPTSRLDDKVTCGKNAVAPYGSRCAFLFKGGAGENSKLVQNIPASSMTGITFSPGQVYTLHMVASNDNSGASVTATVVVNYQDGTKQTLITTTPSLSGTQTYYTSSGSLSQSNVKKFTVTFTFNGTTSAHKVWLDNVQLRGAAGTPLRLEPVMTVLPTPINRDALLPLPGQ